MLILTICLFIAACFPLLSKIILGIAMQQEGKYDNYSPRSQQQRLIGFGARALAAHQNSFEALIFFSTAVLAAIATKSITPTVEALAILFILARIAYHIAYLLNKATCRSSV